MISTRIPLAYFSQGILWLAAALCVAVLPCNAAAPSKTKLAGERSRQPTLVLAFDASGDFGPQTPGTKTAGWQEALNACVKTGRDLYVKGGFGGKKAIYHVSETIRVPAAQDFRIDGGVYVINWTGPAEKDLMQIDSSMNCEYHFGILVYGGANAGMRIRPENPVPIDNFPICIETVIQCQGIADPHPFTPGERKGGTGLVFEGAKAAIVHSEFWFASVLNFRTCIATSGAFSYNRLECPHLHSNADQGTLCTIGGGSFGNTIRFAIGVDQGAKNVTGVLLSGQRNELSLMKRASNAPINRGCALIFEPSAEGNQVNLVDNDLVDLTESITDNATSPNNQVTWAGPALPFRKVQATPGTFTYTQRLYPAAVRMVGGTVRSAALFRGETSLDYSTSLGHDILLSVGDALRIESESPPILEIKPLKTR